jgi:hypothetical protein
MIVVCLGYLSCFASIILAVIAIRRKTKKNIRLAQIALVSDVLFVLAVIYCIISIRLSPKIVPPGLGLFPSFGLLDKNPYFFVTHDLSCCHCEACEAGRSNLMFEMNRLLRFARNDTHRLTCDGLLQQKGFSLNA